MKRLLLATVCLVLLAGRVSAQDWAKERLEKSPRHLEFVKVKSGERDVNCFIAYPEVNDKATAVIVIHEIFGLSDWVRSVADQLAEAGYIAIAPDLLSGVGPEGKGTEGFKSGDEVRRAIQSLKPDQVTADLLAVQQQVVALPACNGNVTVAGFCWGGGQSFRFASNSPELKAAFVFYGSGPESVEKINCPVYGFYGEMDARINASIPMTAEKMKEAGKTYEPVTYDGAGHGFMRAGEAPDASPANKQARDDAWKRWKELLAKIE